MFRKGNATNHAALSIASQLTWGAQGFITFMIAGRLLPQKEFGLVVVANAIMYGSQCLLLGPVTNPTLRFGGVSRKSLYVTYAMYCAVTAIICSAFLFGSTWIGQLINNTPSFVSLIRYLCIPFASICLYSVTKLSLFSKMRYGIALTMDIVFTTTNVTWLLLLHQHGLLTTATSFYMARAGAALIGLAPLLLLYFGLTKHSPADDIQQLNLREYFRHSQYSSISMLSSYAQGQVDVLAVAHFLNPLSAAIYGAAKVFYTGLTMVTTGLVMVVLPTSSRIVAKSSDKLRSYYLKALLFAYALLLPGAILLGIFAEPFIHLCFGLRYAGAVPLVRIFCVAALILPISSVTDAVANGVGWFRRACAASVAGGIVGIGASLSLPRLLGTVGAAISPIAALTCSALVIALLTWRSLLKGASSPGLNTGALAIATQSGDAG